VREYACELADTEGTIGLWSHNVLPSLLCIEVNHEGNANENIKDSYKGCTIGASLPQIDQRTTSESELPVTQF
jgi:hypothetical protein